MRHASRLPLAVIIFLFAGCSENLSETYSDWQAVNASGSMERGWIPKWLPTEAINIKEQHNLDTNALAISFEVTSPNYQLDGVSCEEVEEASKPLIKLDSFPSRIDKMDALRKCDGYFVYQSGTGFYLWKNAS